VSLTPAQQEAVTSWRRGDVCVVAGPGSGKTRVLVDRIRWLVDAKGLEAGAILAITFTKKAAASMKSRLVAGAANRKQRREFERAWISTIDAFCARFLRENAIAAAVDPDFEILEPSDADLELHDALDQALNEAFEEDPESTFRFLHAFYGTEQAGETGLTKIHDEFARAIQAFRGMGREPFEIRQVDHPYPAERTWAVDVLRRALARYEERKRRLGRLDFPDLTIQAIRLLKEGVALPSRFEHILVDENQDTNPLQERLMKALQAAHQRERDKPTLFAVGDLNQSIYAFRHARPEVFRAYRRRVETEGGHPIELLENFRSRPEILAAAEALTRGADGVEPRRLSAGRAFAPKSEPSIEVLLTRSPQRDGFEARWIAARLLELRQSLRISVRPATPGGPVRDRAPRWGDFAILSRTNTRSNPKLDHFAEALRAAGIPYQLTAGRNFFSAEEVRDLLGALRLLDNPRDEIRLAAAMLSPLGGLDELALARLKADKRNLAEALRKPGGDHPPAELAKIERFRALLDRFRAQREDVRADILLSRLVAESGYEAWLLTQPGGVHRAANVAKLIAMVGRTDDGASSYREVIERIEQRRQLSAGESEASAPEEPADAVHLMTLHSAKGLEFPVVVMPSLQAPGNPRSPSLLATAKAGLGGRWLDAAGEKTEDAAYAQAHKDRKTAENQEEDRLFYVGMTRAEEHLILSACWGGKPRRDFSARRLDAFGIDLQPLDKEPHEITLHGCRIRLLRTDQEPPELTAEPTEIARQTAELVDPLPPGGQADSAAAITSISLFADCPRKYYLSRYLGLETAAKPQPDADLADSDPSAGELGREVHEILAGLAKPGDGEAAELARVFTQSALGQRAAAAAEASRERKLLFPVGERLLRGIVDLVFSDNEGRVLVDYKTDRVDSAAQARERSEPYALQLQLYALALARAGEKPERAVLHFLRPDVLVDVDLSPAGLELAERRVEEFFSAQRQQRFEVRPAERCRRCPHYRTLCPAVIPQLEAEKPPPGTQFSLF